MHSTDTLHVVTPPHYQQWAAGFTFNFTSETQYYSPLYVLSSPRPFSTVTQATAHSMNTPNVIQHSHHDNIGPRDLFSILQVRLNIITLSMF